MADPTLDEFERQLNAAGNIQQAPISTQAAIKADLSSNPSITQLDPDVGKANWALRLGARPGVPFDPESGIPFMQRLRLEFQPTKEEQIKALNAAYPGGNARENEFGWLIVTKPGKDGKPVDTLVDPVAEGDIGDLTKVIAVLPELAAGIAGGFALGGARAVPGIVSAAKTLVGMVAGTALEGAAQDVAVRTAEGNPLDLKEIASRRGEQAAQNFVVGTVAGGIAKVGTTLLSPLSGSSGGPIQFNAKTAREYFSRNMGVKYNFTPAESTGNSFLRRAEAIESQKPGSSVPFEHLMEEQENAVNQIRQIAMGGAVPDEEAAGARALAALGAKTRPLTDDVERAAFQAQQAASGEIRADIGPKIDRGDLGAQIRAKANELRKDFRAQREDLYAQVYSDPRTQTKNISGRQLANSATQLEKTLPTIPGQVISSPGTTPIVATPDEVLTEFVEPGVLPKIKALQRGRNADFTLNELQQMRTSIDNDIAAGEAIPGKQTRDLTTLRDIITARIKSGLTAIDPDLLQKWQTANDFVANNVGKFKQAGIAELFRSPEQSNFIGDSHIVSRVMGEGGQDFYKAYKGFFGANSPELQGIQQAVRDHVLNQSNLSPVIDAVGLARRLESLPDNILKDAFPGASAQDLYASAKILAAAKGQTVATEDLQQAMASGRMSAEHMRQMLSSEATKTAAYRNDLIKQISEGNLKPDTLKPTEVVDRFVFNKDTQPKDLKDLMGMLNDHPDIQEDLRRITFQKFLDQNSIVNKKTGRLILAADDMEAMLGDQQMEKRLRTVLGPTTYLDLEQLTHLLKPGAAVQQAARTAGGFGAGTQTAGLIEHGALKYLDAGARNFVISSIYTSPPLRKFIGNTFLGPTMKAGALNYVIASSPFIESLMHTYGSGKASQAIMANIKSGIDQAVRADPSQGTVDPSLQDFEKMLGK